MPKPLTIDNPSLAKLRTKYVPVYYLNGRYRVFTWENRPRHQNPIGILPIRLPGKTVSEVVAAYNTAIIRGKSIDNFLIKGTRVERQVEHEPIIDEQPREQRIIIRKPTPPAETYSRQELKDMFND